MDVHVRDGLAGGRAIIDADVEGVRSELHVDNPLFVPGRPRTARPALAATGRKTIPRIDAVSHEVAGGYLWSPKRKSNGGINPYYESMREVAPGDIVLSFADTRIAAIGIARSHCYECPKPREFVPRWPICNR
jgi:hypothetical protein